jgi:hypothetical protein
VSPQLTIAHDFEDTSRTVSAEYQTNPVGYSVTAPGMGDTEFRMSLGTEWAVTESLRLNVGYSLGVSGDSDSSNAVNVNAIYSF